MEKFISDLNSIGWLVGSLCQLSRAEWYVCMIDDEGFSHTATGIDPVDAIQIALTRPPSGRVYNSNGAFVDERGESIDKVSLVSLGLIKKKSPITRRF